MCLGSRRSCRGSGPNFESCTLWNEGNPVRPLSESTAAEPAFARNITSIRSSVVEADPAGGPNCPNITLGGPLCWNNNFNKMGCKLNLLRKSLKSVKNYII